MSNLYIKRDLLIREIVRQMNVSHSTVIECLRRLGIHDKGARKRDRYQGQIPFGYNYRKGNSKRIRRSRKLYGLLNS